jgi:hypothetical protein
MASSIAFRIVAREKDMVEERATDFMTAKKYREREKEKERPRTRQSPKGYATIDLLTFFL